MNILHLLSSVSRANGGISESVRRLAQAQAQQNAGQVKVLGLREAFTDQDLPLWKPLQPDCFHVRGPRALGYAPGLVDALARSPAEVVHQAGLWMFPSVAQRRAARRRKRPYVISPHGMLDAWAVQNSAWKKKLAAGLFERAHLEEAACLHALCAAEAESIRAYGLRNPICIVPNGIDIPPAAPTPRLPVWSGRVPADQKVMLFLGRIHPKKGLMPLVKAWAVMRELPWHLVVVGWDQGGHQAELEAMVRALRLSERISFCGPLHGAEKAAAYAAAEAFILPSFSEGLPMTVLEAWAHGKPVLMTAACNLPEGFSAGAALEIFTEPDRLAQALLHVAGWPEKDRAAMGARGRVLAEKTFNWDHIAGELLAVYRWVAGQGPQPDSVQK